MKYILCLIILIPLALEAQVRDGFTDGDFTSNPSWIGDTSAFTINSQHQLQLNSSGSDTSCLSTRIDPKAAIEWSFWTKLSFNTSLNNYARFYLGSDSPALSNAMNSIYLQIGGTGDSLIMFRQNGNIHKPLFAFPALRTNKTTNCFRIRIIRDSSGIWELYCDSTGGIRLHNSGSFTFQQAMPEAWMGVLCRYTSGNSNRFFFDDFYAGSIIRDTVPPQILSAGFSDSLTIRIKFSEFVDSTSIEKGLNYSLKNNSEKLGEAYILSNEPDVLNIRINEDENSFFCDTLYVKNISDYSNNLMMDSSIFLCYYIPGPCLPGDLLINEVLFDPDAAGSRFVECYNRSLKVIDLSSLIIGTSDLVAADTHTDILSKGIRMLNPYDYYVISYDSAKLCSRYFVPDPGKISTTEHFPSMNQDSGSVYLMTVKDSLLIDAMAYSQVMHLPFLLNTEGVSLERQDSRAASSDRSIWQSASETSGFASPGYENSHYAIDPENGIDVQLSSQLISPDNDGREDLLYIRFNSVEAGTLLSLRIFDIKGNAVKTIASPALISENSLFVWNGTNDNNSIVPIGYYVILSESISLTGKRSCVKKAVAVVQKF